jgi:hypothetical protein
VFVSSVKYWVVQGPPLKGIRIFSISNEIDSVHFYSKKLKLVYIRALIADIL